MKVFVTILFFLFPVVAAAQNHPGMNEADLQNMMQRMQQMQECMEKIDPAEMKALEQRGDEFEAELNTLCAQGKRDEAQKKAIAYGKEMMENPAIKQMKECGELTRGMLPPDQQESFDSDFDFDFSKRHVCDE